MAIETPEAARPVRARATRPWDPRDVLEMKTETYPSKHAGPIPMGDFANKSLGLGQKTALNQGWIGSQIEPMADYWDSIKLKPNAAQLYLDKLFAEQDTLFHPALDPFTWSDMQIAGENWYAHQVEPWIPGELKTDWLDRDYQTSDSVYERIYWHHSGGFFCDGHGAYKNLHKGVTFRWCLFDELGGNAIQLVNREDTFKKGKPAVDNRKAVGGPVLIEKSVIQETGYSDGRGSFPISLMGLGRPGRQFDVTVRDVLVSCRWGIPDSDGHRSRGGLLVEAGLVGNRAYGTVLVENFKAVLSNPDRQILAINNSESVKVTGCEFIVNGGNTWIDLDRYDFEGFKNVMPCGKIEWAGNDGNVQVRLRDKIIGPCTGAYLIENGVSK
jgi:hypothetical protein